MTGESFFSLGSAAAGSCLGHDAIHRTEHSLERVARGLGRGWSGKIPGGGVCEYSDDVSVLWRARKGSSISGTETQDSRMTIVVDGFRRTRARMMVSQCSTMDWKSDSTGGTE